MSDEYLFDMSLIPEQELCRKFKSIEIPLWTKNKAQFIARYLKAFTYVTKHGTYIDAFSGPQHEGSKDVSCAAKLVLENEPFWLGNFHLFELNSDKIDYLNTLKDGYLSKHDQDKEKKTVTVTHGDCNQTLPMFLAENPIKDKEATFCLLDQKSTECHWDTVRKIATHKSGDGVNKIEIFYFFAQGWIDRTVRSRTVNAEKNLRWGSDDLDDFLSLQNFDRARFLAERFKKEFEYKHCYPFPIQKNGEIGTIMFYMIHASDHDRATSLMLQAYRHIGAGGGLNEPIKQEELGLFDS